MIKILEIEQRKHSTNELFQRVLAYKQVYLANRSTGFPEVPQCPEAEGRSKEVPKMKTSTEGGTVQLSSL